MEDELKRLLAIAALAALALAHDARACTTFCFARGGTHVFGKNYDWNVDAGMVVVNKRGVTKTALTEDNPASWTSRFGSVTFNQYGREFPSGGINEAGLVVELMWLDQTVFPEPDRRRALPTLQWIQYQLDNASTIDEVIASDAKVRIGDAGTARIHFLVADASGATATVEFLNGRMVVHRGDELPYPVLTNDMYQVSVTYARDRDASAPLTSSSLDRFARASRGLAPADPKRSVVDDAFALLDDVAQPGFTQWSIVYDLDARRAYFRTRRNRDVRFVDLKALDFSCDTPVRVVDMNAAYQGDLTKRFDKYSLQANRKLVQTSFSETEFLRDTPREKVNALASYPDGTSCAR